MNRSAEPLTNIELMDRLGRIYGFEVKGQVTNQEAEGEGRSRRIDMRVPGNPGPSETRAGEERQDGLPSLAPIIYGTKNGEGSNNHTGVVMEPTNEGEKRMAERQKCKNGDGTQAVKDGLCCRCYTKQNGHTFYSEGRPKSAGGGVAKARKAKGAPSVPANPEQKGDLKKEINKAFTLAELEEAGRKIAASHPVKTVSAPARARLTVITLEMDGSPPMELIAQLFEAARGR